MPEISKRVAFRILARNWKNRDAGAVSKWGRSGPGRWPNRI